MYVPVFVHSSMFRIALALTICGSLLVSPSIPSLASTTVVALNQNSESAARPRPDKPEGELPDLEQVQAESGLEREALLPIPSMVRSAKVPLEPWNGRRVGDSEPPPKTEQTEPSQPAGAQVRRAHARRRFNPLPPPVLDDQFVQNFFTWAVLRAPTATEATYWKDQLRVAYAQGPASVKLAAVEFGKTMFESAEYAARNRDNHWYVYDLYKTFLMRDPDASGWANWESMVPINGRVNVRRAFEEAPEFATILASIVPNGSPSANPASLTTARVEQRNQPGHGMLARDANWSVSLLSLPGRNGLDLGLGLSYSSMVWTRSGPYLHFDEDNGFPSPGFRLGFPSVQRRVFNAQTAKNAYLLITAAGRRVELRQVGTSNVYEAADSSYLQLTDNSPNLLLRATDGTQLSFTEIDNEYRCTQVKDRNGNYITVGRNALGQIASVTDTLGRIINFNYDSNANLISITQAWNGQLSHQWVSFGWSTRNMQPGFTSGAIVGTATGQVLPVITQVALNDTSHFTFDYTNALQVSIIRNYFGAIERNATTFTYETPAGDVPRLLDSRVSARNWTGVNGVPAQVVTTYSVTGDGACVRTAPDGTIYKEYYGTGWQKGLKTLSEVWSGGVKQKWTTTAWTQDNTSVAYQLNPRVTETNVYDVSSNRRRIVIDYGTYAQWGLPYTVKEYANDGVTELRRSVTDYNLSQAYLDRRIIGLVSQVLLLANVSSNQGKITYGYDDPARLQTLPAAPIRHDSTYNTSFTARGNVTSVSRWDFTDINNAAKKLTSYTNYSIAGTSLSTTDASGHQSSVSYADAFSDNVNRNTFAYPTTLTDADGFSSSVQYNYDFGATTRTQSPAPAGQSQGAIQTMTYNSLGQLERVTTSNNGAYKRFWYGADFVASYATVNNVADELYAIEVFDGHGRVIGAAGNHPGSTGGYRLLSTIYDHMGRLKKQSNPTEVNSSWTPTGDDAVGMYYTQQTYDWQGRPLVTTNQDGTTKTAAYSGCGCAGGAVVTLTDEGTLDGGVAKRRQQKIYSDVFGRTVKTEILNWQGGSVYSTVVNTYNVRDQVTQIRQYAGLSSSGTYQDTTMTYDGYGRLKTRHIPQQDATKSTSYSYYPDDRPQSVTDARGATTSYQYNNRHLISSITHTAPAGIVIPATSAFGYDATGNRLWMTDGLGRVDYEYNQLSQMTAETRTFNQSLPQAPLSNNRYKLSYTYNLAGTLSSLKDPFNSTVNYGRDSRGRLTVVTGSPFGVTTTYASNARYRAWGGLKHVEYGNGQQMNATFAQLKPASFTVTGPGQQVVQRQYQYYADGRLRYVQDQLDPKFDRLNEYDQVGRIRQGRSGAEARGQTEPNHQNLPYHFSYTYDAFGHMTGRTGTQWIINNNVTQSFANDRQDFVVADADGRQLFGAVSGFEDPWGIIDQYGYDAAGRMATIDQWGDPPPADGTSPDPPERRLQRLTSGRDGDGLELKQAVVNYAEDGQTVVSSFNKFYIPSSVLGGRIITEVWGDGRKTRSFVYADGTVLAWQVMRIQAGGPDIPEVWWEVRDPGGTMVQMRDQAGVWDSWKVSYSGMSMTKAELDPIGTDVGWTYGVVLPPPPPPSTGSFGGGFGWPDPEGDPELPDGRRLTCVVDGHRTPCANAFAVLRLGIGVDVIKIDGPFSSLLSSRFAITETKRWVSGTKTSHVSSRVSDGDWSEGEVTAGEPGHFETTGYEVSGFENLELQEPWIFNWGIHDFSDEERNRIRRAFEKVKSERCKKWFEDTIKALGKPDLSVEATRPKTMDQLLEYAEFNKYDPKLTAADMRISQEQRNKIADKYENRFTNLSIANAVTLGPDFTRIYLMPSAFWQDSSLAPYSGRDLSGIITFELLHVAGFGDDAIWKLRTQLQRHCGNPTDLL